MSVHVVYYLVVFFCGPPLKKMSVNSAAVHGATAFSSDSAEAIRRRTELGQSQLSSVTRSDECLKEYFEMNRCAQFVSSSPDLSRVSEKRALAKVVACRR